MTQKNIIFNYKGKKIEILVKVCNLVEKFVGLMFTKKEKAKALLLFDFKKSRKMAIHSYFVFFPFIAIWLNEDNKVVDLKIIKPFTFSICPKKPFYKLVEIPFNSNYKEVIKHFGFPRRE